MNVAIPSMEGGSRFKLRLLSLLMAEDNSYLCCWFFDSRHVIGGQGLRDRLQGRGSHAVGQIEHLLNQPVISIFNTEAQCGFKKGDASFMKGGFEL